MKSDVADKRVGVACLVLFISQAALVILSWLLSAIRLEGVRSMLSSEGIRWFFGSFTQVMASPLLVWLLLLLMASGCVFKSGLPACLWQRPFRPSYRDRIALRVSVVFLMIYLLVISLLTLSPHAILLSASGALFPSAFSRSLIPVIAFGFCVVGVSFGMMSGHLRSLVDILSSLSYGIRYGALVIVLYVFLMQFASSLRFVFG